MSFVLDIALTHLRSRVRQTVVGVLGVVDELGAAVLAPDEERPVGLHVLAGLVEHGDLGGAPTVQPSALGAHLEVPERLGGVLAVRVGQVGARVELYSF